MGVQLLLASIPSPGSRSIEIGPLDLRAYGLAIAVGVIAAVIIGQRRWQRAGGDPSDIVDISTWAVPAGIVGARAWHVLTDWEKFRGDWLDAFAIWKGGLGIPGALIAGVLAGIVVARRKDISLAGVLDAVAPAIPVAQAIGRLGNWFNQELFGRPTDLPWGLEIDPENRPVRFAHEETFHPTFLYEALWNLALAAGLVLLGRRRRLREGQLFVLYVAGYAVGRLWVEMLRVDPASKLLGLRVNIWTSIVALVLALAVLVARSRQSRERVGVGEHVEVHDAAVVDDELAHHLRAPADDPGDPHTPVE